MNSWRMRILMLLLILAVMLSHEKATVSIPNTPVGMLMFHGSAALFDWLLLMVTPYLLIGRICDDTQWLLLASIIGNFLGWMLYMAYASPIFYNSFMWGLTCVQWLRFLIPDGHDANHLGSNLVHGRHRFGHFLHLGKASK